MHGDRWPKALPYGLAKAEHALRADIYSWDALAWTALKAGKTDEAAKAASEAIKLGTPDPRLWYHAGMAALAASDKPAARERLEKALGMCPQFDVLQAPKARAALEGLRR